MLRIHGVERWSSGASPASSRLTTVVDRRLCWMRHGGNQEWTEFEKGGCALSHLAPPPSGPQVYGVSRSSWRIRRNGCGSCVAEAEKGPICPIGQIAV